MKKKLFFTLVLLCIGGVLSAQVSTTRSVSVKRTRIQTDYQYFLRLGVGSLDLDRADNNYERRSSLPFGGTFSWGFRKPFNNSPIAIYWGMEYGAIPYSTSLSGYYNTNYPVYTFTGQLQYLPSEDLDHPYFSVYSHALNATPLMLGLDFKAPHDISVDLHVGVGVNLTFLGRYIYDNGDSFSTMHGDGAIGLWKNEGRNHRVYPNAQLGLGVWWRNLNLEITAMAMLRNIRLSTEVPYDYVSYDKYGNNPQNYTSLVSLSAYGDITFPLFVRLGFAI